jgi:hypothetical protein
MTAKKPLIEYDLSELESFAKPSLENLRAEGQYFTHRDNEFVGASGHSKVPGWLTLAETQAAIKSLRRKPQHAVRVYVASKYLAGDGLGLKARTRVFSNYKGVDRFLMHDPATDPSPNPEDVLISMTTCVVDAVEEHRPCNCKEEWLQEEALEALEPAKPGPTHGGRVDARATAVQALPQALLVTLQDGRRLEVPRDWFGFLDADDNAQWQGVHLDGTREYIIWPGTRKRVPISGLLVDA